MIPDRILLTLSRSERREHRDSLRRSPDGAVELLPVGEATPSAPAPERIEGGAAPTTGAPGPISELEERFLHGDK